MVKLIVRHPARPGSAAAAAVKCLERGKIPAEIPAQGDKEEELGEGILILNPRRVGEAVAALKADGFEVHIPAAHARYS
jgi:hypothetical protein